MTQKRKVLEEATSFLEAFGVSNEDNVASVRRCVDMLREAKRNGKIDEFSLYASTTMWIEDENPKTAVVYCVKAECGGSFLCVGVEDDVRKLQDATKRVLRAMAELKPILSRCDYIMWQNSFDVMCPPQPMSGPRLSHAPIPGCYAEICD